MPPHLKCPRASLGYFTFNETSPNHDFEFAHDQFGDEIRMAQLLGKNAGRGRPTPSGGKTFADVKQVTAPENWMSRVLTREVMRCWPHQGACRAPHAHPD